MRKTAYAVGALFGALAFSTVSLAQTPTQPLPTLKPGVVQPQVKPKVQPQLKPGSGLTQPQISPDAARQMQPGIRTPGATPTPRVPPGGFHAGCAIDPAAEPMRAIHVRRDTRNNTYLFWLSAVVKNVGTEAYEGGAGQAQATLREGNRVIVTRSFTRLAPGQTISMGTTITGWRTSDEFPPDYTLEISYGPDIRIDGNPKNDDCRMNNNKTVLSGQQILNVIRTFAARY
jgi:hypothetical protein